MTLYVSGVWNGGRIRLAGSDLGTVGAVSLFFSEILKWGQDLARASMHLEPREE